MDSNLIMLVIMSAGAASVIVLLVFALVAGRLPPTSRVRWIIALAITVVPALFVSMAAVGATIAGGVGWVIIGAVGLWALIGVTWFRPAWAGWGYLVSGLAIPIAVAIAQSTLSPDPPMEVDAGMVFTFYGVRSLITAALLLWPARPHDLEQPDLEQPAQSRDTPSLPRS